MQATHVMVGDDPEIEAIFRKEARTRVAGLLDTLAKGGSESRYALFRDAHTLKGIADMAGHDDVARLAADIVGRLRDPQGKPLAPSAADEAALREDVRRLEREVARLTGPD